MKPDSDQKSDSSAVKPPPAETEIFDHHIPMAQTATENVRPRAAVYMFLADDKPILLATTANLKHAIGLRLGPDRSEHKTDYQAITTHVSWRYVNSAFAANWWYLLASRKYYADTYRTLLAWRPAWYLRVDLESDRHPPSVDVQNRAAGSEGVLFGPFASRRSASELADWMLEHFELCRYEDILRKYPHGQPCAYKEMGKCSAPCDGSESMEEYRIRVRQAIELLSAMAPLTRTVTHVTELEWYKICEDRMKRAAVEMNFRAAAKMKTQLTSLAERFDSPIRGWGPMDQWKYMALQRGTTRRWIEPWILVPGMCTALPPVEAARVAADGPALVRGWIQSLHETSIPTGGGALADDVPAMLTYHLNRSRDPGLYLSSADLMHEVDVVRCIEQWHDRSDTGAVMEFAGESLQQPENGPTPSPES
ncbi:MAG: hypothetical protein ACP5O1_10555 [Phycisphaerae bacterium]